MEINDWKVRSSVEWKVREEIRIVLTLVYRHHHIVAPLLSPAGAHSAMTGHVEPSSGTSSLD